MKPIKNTVCLLLACILCAAPAQAQTGAQGNYKATTLTLPADMETDPRVQSLSVHGEKLDLFAEEQTMEGKFLTRHHHSDDGGKTWKEQDASWMNGLGGDMKSQPFTAVREDGTVYAMVAKGEAAKLKNLTYGYTVVTLAAYKDGNTRVLCKLDNKDYSYYDCIGLTGEGDILLEAIGQNLDQWLGESPNSMYFTIDAATGKEKTAAAKEERRISAIAFDNGVVLQGGSEQLKLVDAATGKVKQNIPSPPGEYAMNIASAYGAFYVLTPEGLFRIKPGETAWTKLLDSSVCQKGMSGSDMTNCPALAVDKDGSILILLKHLDTSGFRAQLKAVTFTRYTPA